MLVRVRREGIPDPRQPSGPDAQSAPGGGERRARRPGEEALAGEGLAEAAANTVMARARRPKRKPAQAEHGQVEPERAEPEGE